MKKFTLILFSLLGLSSMANAQSLEIDKTARPTLGLSIGYSSDSYVGNDGVVVAPYVFFDNNRLYAEGTEAGFYPYKDDKNHLRVGLSYDGREFDPSDSDNASLALLDKRQAPVLAHASYMRITPVGGFRVKVANDIFGEHNGTSVAVMHISRFIKGDLTIYPIIGATWYDDNYNDYYYSVSPQESSKSGINTYTATSGVSPFVSLTANYKLNDKLTLTANTRTDWLSSTQKDSPLVDGSSNTTVRLGLGYKF